MDENPAEVGRLLYELAPRIARLENLVLRQMKPPLTFRQYRVLDRIDFGRVTATSLRRNSTISLPAISETVDVLVGKKLLQRTLNHDDRRESILSLTAAGQASLDEARQLLSQSAHEVLIAIPKDRQALLREDLEAVDKIVTECLKNGRVDRSKRPRTGFVE